MASNVDIIVGATVDGALGGLRAVSGAIDRLQPAAAAIGAVGKAAFTVVSAAVAAAGAALVSFVKQASEAEEVTAKFDAIVGSSALANYRTEMLGLADALSQVTRFDDEAILAAETQLAIYENIGQEIFPQVIDTALDLAEVMGVDAVQGAETLGKALADIEGGSLSLLKRQRLLTEEQVKTAEAMAETGDVAGAQAYILDILDGKIGDVAETMGKTLNGQLTILKTKLGNVAEELGGKLLPVLAPVVAKFAELVDKYAPMVGAFFDKIIVPGLQKATTEFLDFINAMSSGEFNLEEFLLGIDFGALSESFISAVQATDWNAIGTEIGHWIGVAFDVAKNFVSDTDWSGIFASLGKALMDFATGLAGSNTEEFISVWSQNFALLSQILANIVRIVSTWAAGLKQKIDAGVRAAAGGIANGFMAATGKIVAAVNVIATRIVSAFKSFTNRFREVGKAILGGIKQGILNGWDSFAAWLTGIVEQIVQSVLDALGIQSPSKVFAKIGEQMMAGMAKGIGDGVVVPIRAMNSAIPQIVGSTLQAAGNTQNNYYYGSRFLLAMGQENSIIATLTE